MQQPVDSTSRPDGLAGPDALTLAPIAHAQGDVQIPGSKSISNRALLLSALALGRTELQGLLAADDVARMREALAALGVRTESGAAGAVHVHGCAGRFPSDRAKLFLGNAGTAVRPLTAALAMLGGDYEISGVARMHERPIGDLVDPLAALGCEIRYLGTPGYPPLAIGRGHARAGMPLSVRGDVSSQFLSALLMALPLAEGAADRATRVQVTTPLISRPYVEITLNLMRRFGVDVATEGESAFVVPAGARYRSPGTLRVEGDASSATYFLAAGVLGGGPVRVQGVDRGSIQGDVAFADVLAQLGADVRFGDGWVEARSTGRLDGGEIDCTNIPDAAMTLAVLALFASRSTTLRGIGSWRVKETDRIAAMATELAKLGAKVEAGASHLTVTPPRRLHAGARIATYDDHRMAMCFSLAAFGGVPVTIEDPGCVSKTFPEYFDVFARLSRPVADG
jgi:3-phosphoshikimate 1-carboxyvinyltransferase